MSIDAAKTDFTALFPDEVITLALARDIALPRGAGTFVLITLDNGFDHPKPNTFGPATLSGLTGVLSTLRARAEAGEIVGVEPEVMGIGPVPATEKALAQAGLTIDDIGLMELNEAFAVQVLAFLDHFDIADDDPRVNQYGGAIATGHPLASSGVRLMTQLARQFEESPQVRYGLTAMCIGIGMGGAVIWENPHHKDYGKELDTIQGAVA